MHKIFHYSAIAAIFLLGACTKTDVHLDIVREDIHVLSSKNTKIQSDSDRIKADVEFLADDERKGRKTGTDGYLQAAEYTAARMSAIGLLPGANGNWFQPVRIREVTPVLADSKFEIVTSNNEVIEFEHLVDYRVFPSISKKQTNIKGEVVFIGYGISAPSLGHDDYDGIDVSGKIVAYIGSAPQTFEAKDRSHYANGYLKQNVAKEHGAIGMINLQTEAYAKLISWERMISRPTRSSVNWVGDDGHSEQLILPVIMLNLENSTRVFENSGMASDEIFGLINDPGKTRSGIDLNVQANIRGGYEFSDIISPNVVGYIPGSDPKFKDEVVVITAHLDHIGVNEDLIAKGEDGIFNGALDNAIGIAAILNVAERFIEGERPARTIVFVATTGEEIKLLGAGFYAQYPTVPLESIVANVNLDMAILLDELTDIIAFGAEHSSLGESAKLNVENVGLTLSPDPIPGARIFMRSDMKKFVQKGIPSIMLWPGFENGGKAAYKKFSGNNYHQVSDSTDLPIRYDQAALYSEINYYLIQSIANEVERPSWSENSQYSRWYENK